jgi:hypothetical protein
MVEQLLQSNQQLCARLRNLEDAFDARSVVARAVDDASVVSHADGVITIPTTSSGNSILMPSTNAFGARNFTFEEDLEKSRVYRMARRNDCAHSLVSSAVRTQTWSIFSGLSLADISTISVIALPLYANEVLAHAQQHPYIAESRPSLSRSATHPGPMVTSWHRFSTAGELPRSNVDSVRHAQYRRAFFPTRDGRWQGREGGSR